MPHRKIAVVLFNLGGPDKPESVKPFLVNLFKDPAILRVPFFVRPFLARLIATLRVKAATANYEILGGKSPLLELTEHQARSLETALPGHDVRCFVAMRYWHPFSIEAARAVAAWDPEEVVLVPLYPHYSTTTTGSSLTAWREAAAAAGLMKPTTTLCCYHSDPAFLRATTALVRDSYAKARAELPPETGLRILFSAHGLPESIIKAGDPYQFQVERTVAGVVRLLDIEGLDYTTCYQSRATPQKWIDPSTEVEIERAAHDNVAVLVVPIAFVSRTFRDAGRTGRGIPRTRRARRRARLLPHPAQNSDQRFIDSLADLVEAALGRGPGLCSFVGAVPARSPSATVRMPAPAWSPTWRPNPYGNSPRPARGEGLSRASPGRHAAKNLLGPLAPPGAVAEIMMNEPLRPQPLRLVIFDCDGVLVDSEGPSNRVCAQEITKLGWPMTEAESMALFVGFRLSDMPPLIEARLGRPVPDGWVEHLRDRIIQAFDTLETMPGAHQALRDTLALGLPVRVASNSSHEEMDVKFRHTRLDPLVPRGRRHSARDVLRGKPSPDVFLAAAAAEGVPPEACIVVEDSLPGIAAATAAGMPVIALVPHGVTPAVRATAARPILTLAELPGIFAAAMAIAA